MKNATHALFEAHGDGRTLHNMSLADLITLTLGRTFGPVQADDDALENFIDDTATEIGVCRAALANEDEADVAGMLDAMQLRVLYGGELLRRVRVARVAIHDTPAPASDAAAPRQVRS